VRPKPRRLEAPYAAATREGGAQRQSRRARGAEQSSARTRERAARPTASKTLRRQTRLWRALQRCALRRPGRRFSRGCARGERVSHTQGKHSACTHCCCASASDSQIRCFSSPSSDCKALIEAREDCDDRVSSRAVQPALLLRTSSSTASRSAASSASAARLCSAASSALSLLTCERSVSSREIDVSACDGNARSGCKRSQTHARQHMPCEARPDAPAQQRAA
jgi:hypothetical protein